MAKKANLKLYCCKLEDLIQAVFDIRFGIKVKINFPILNEKCDIIFKSLKTFKYYITDIDNQTLKNIYFNIDKMPNLKSFSLDGKINDEDLYIKFIKKMLSLDLDYLRIKSLTAVAVGEVVVGGLFSLTCLIFEPPIMVLLIVINYGIHFGFKLYKKKY